MTRRGRSEGTITKRADGRWEARLHLGYANGKRLRKSFFGRTRAEVADKLTRARADQQRGVTIRSNERETVGAFLIRWLADVETTLRPRTREGYAAVLERHLIPTIGKITLTKLTRADVRALLTSRTRAGRSPQTVRNIHGILRHALNRAVQDDLIPRNPAVGIELPRLERIETTVISPDLAARVLDAFRGDRLEGLVTVALLTGLRQGEALGLRWDDIDFTASELIVRRSLQRIARVGMQEVEPKTQRSRRSVALPSLASEALVRERDRQRFAARMAGSRWVDSGYVFTSTVGTPLSGPRVTARFQERLAATGLPRLRFHDLRHGTASLMLAMGEHPRTIMETLGHSTIRVTMDTYAHVLPSVQRDAANRLDDAVRKAQTG